MPNRVTIWDVAKLADVSVATVDRVLNRRGGVRMDTMERVTQAAANLGYADAEGKAQRTDRKPMLRVTLLLPDDDSDLPEMLARAAQTALEVETVAAILPTLARYSAVGGEASRALDGITRSRADWVCLFTKDPHDAKPAIDRLEARGVRVCLILADAPTSRRTAYIGVDEVAAGRVAGRMLVRMLGTGAGDVVVCPGSVANRAHAERMLGFRQILTEHAPRRRLVEVEEADLSAALADGRETGAIYAARCDNAQVLTSLRALPPGLRPPTVLHGAAPLMRNALTEGHFDMIVRQDPDQIMRAAFQVIIRAQDGDAPVKTILAPQIHVIDNLP